jgi:hypothetical protein
VFRVSKFVWEFFFSCFVSFVINSKHTQTKHR